MIARRNNRINPLAILLGLAAFLLIALFACFDVWLYHHHHPDAYWWTYFF